MPVQTTVSISGMSCAHCVRAVFTSLAGVAGIDRADVSIGKARTAANFRKATRAFEDTINKGRYAMIPVAAVTDFTPLQGGVPLIVNGQVVGAIGVSGASSAQQDEEIATAGAQALAGDGK